MIAFRGWDRKELILGLGGGVVSLPLTFLRLVRVSLPGMLRTAYWLGDSAVHLHALTSLITQAEQLLPQAVHDARDQELTWTQIGELLGTTAATAARRYRNKP